MLFNEARGIARLGQDFGDLKQHRLRFQSLVNEPRSTASNYCNAVQYSIPCLQTRRRHDDLEFEGSWQGVKQASMEEESRQLAEADDLGERESLLFDVTNSQAYKAGILRLALDLRTCFAVVQMAASALTQTQSQPKHLHSH